MNYPVKRRSDQVATVWVSLDLDMRPLCLFVGNGNATGHTLACKGSQRRRTLPNVRQMRPALGLMLLCDKCQQRLLRLVNR